MIIYQENKTDFIKECDKRVIADSVAQNMRHNGINYFDDSQIEAWANSLPAISNVLKKTSTDDDIDVAIEYKFNQSKDRIDFLIYGKDGDGKNNGRA